MNTTVRTLLRGAVAASMALGAMLSASPARAALSCFVGFDDFDALNGMWADARATFTYETGYADGYLVPCEEAEGSCWTYRQYCEGMQQGANYINVEDGSGYGHYHLSFTNPGFTGCGFVDPGDRQADRRCLRNTELAGGAAQAPVPRRGPVDQGLERDQREISAAVQDVDHHRGGHAHSALVPQDQRRAVVRL
jgi:hypothetical protein